LITGGFVNRILSGILTFLLVCFAGDAFAGDYGCGGVGSQGQVQYFVKLTELTNNESSAFITEISGQQRVDGQIHVTTSNSHWPLVYTQVGSAEHIRGFELTINADQTGVLKMQVTLLGFKNVRVDSLGCRAL
jgi:hypothetical protein